MSLEAFLDALKDEKAAFASEVRLSTHTHICL